MAQWGAQYARPVSFLSRPVTVFRRIAIAEAITWALLLFGMFLKYGPADNQLGVRVFGMIHGVVFIAYVVTTAVVWVDQQWSWKRGLVALGAAIPPFATYAVEVVAVRNGWLGEQWRLRGAGAAGLSGPERLVRWLLDKPLRGLAVAGVAVVVLTGLALVVGPPASS
jgi:integral membrane protein